REDHDTAVRMHEEFDSVARFEMKMIPNGLGDRGLSFYAECGVHRVTLYILQNVMPRRIKESFGPQCRRQNSESFGPTASHKVPYFFQLKTTPLQKCEALLAKIQSNANLQCCASAATVSPQPRRPAAPPVQSNTRYAQKQAGSA